MTDNLVLIQYIQAHMATNTIRYIAHHTLTITQ